MNKAVSAYLIATHGRREVTEDHPAVRQQVANIRIFVRKVQSRTEEQEGGKTNYYFDYARKVRGLSSLPKLERALTRVSEGHFLIMDGLSRLWRACPNREARDRLLADLELYSSKLFGVRQISPLSDLTRETIDLLMSGALNPRFQLAPREDKRPHIKRQLQTASASVMSKKVRRSAADAKAHELHKIRDELQAGADRVTNKMIADRANEQGLRTTRGGPWRPDTVARQLKRLSADPHSKDDP